MSTKHSVGDKAQRYEIRCNDGEGNVFTMGWSNAPDSFKETVEKHPVWNSREVVDRWEIPAETQEDWINRCAAIFVMEAGMDLREAKDLADAQLELLDVDLTESPEESAYSEMSYWTE